MSRHTNARKENTSKMLARTAFIAILLASLLAAVSAPTSALGVAPSRQYISFAPGLKIAGELTIINGEARDFRAQVYAGGDWAGTVTIPRNLVSMSADQQIATVTYEIQLPDTMPPGEQEIQLVVQQFPVEVEGKTSVTAQAALISQVIIRVPYPGKYVEAKVFVSDAEKGDMPVTFTTMIYNFGTEDIKDASVQVGIFGPTWEQVGETRSGHTSILSKQEARLDAVWQPNVSKGSYVAVATVRYDDKTLKIEKPFDLGKFSIDISDISVKRFTLGDVAKFDILLYNSWNREIKDVWVQMAVEDRLGNKMTEFKTTTVDIPSESERQVEAYWYTEGVVPDVYKVKVIVHYGSGVTQKDYDFRVETNRITRADTEGYAAMTGQQKKEMSMQSVIVILIMAVVVLLVTMNVIWYYIFTRKLKGGGK